MAERLCDDRALAVADRGPAAGGARATERRLARPFRQFEDDDTFAATQARAAESPGGLHGANAVAADARSPRRQDHTGPDAGGSAADSEIKREEHSMSTKALRRVAVLGAAGLIVWVAGAASAGTQANLYRVNALVSDSAATPAAAADASLVNGWGLTAGPTTPWWAANNGTGTSTLYNGAGAKQALAVTVAGGPTGVVFNGAATDFVVSEGGKSGAARFLFATESGRIAGWSPGVNANTAVTGVDRSASKAIYKGLAIANDKLYATDFHNARVDVFDKTFGMVRGGFSDRTIPKSYAPFGIQTLAGNVFVTYARQDAAKEDDVPVPGQGFVDEFTPDGALVARVVNSGKRNAPLNAAWGLALAPSNFGVFSGDLLVANFGNGRISAYTQRGSKWVYKGQLRRGNGTAVVIDGLWAIAFGNGAAAGTTTTLYFLSGPSGEKHGLFGSISAG